MAWWGKLAGGAFGFMIGGPIGALLGASLGHKLDQGITSVSNASGFLPGHQERVQTAFFTTTFSIMGYIAKSDGHVSKQEIDMAQQVMEHMQLNPEQKKLAITLFNQGKQKTFKPDEILDQFRQECHGRNTLIRVFMEIQVQAALADGKFDPKESQALKEISHLLRFSLSELEQIIQMIRGTSHTQSSSKQTTLQDAYDILGVNANTSMGDIKKSYRRLLSQHHPDKLVSKGLPEEMIKIANEKTHEIRMAWKTIQAARATA